ncbi:hypothetical protein [Shewanella sp. Isolate11]|uniref:hypothetical protein n=1 Tax=Shewanella sp. Isolate11 TaxID=2908530 RepID=UPI001EFCC5D6|nr:hypothetical protein [Shewanella sp. Isolate11]MCG9698363.1 hypothetical protein [Shewanella sp. Isolate11]
MKDIKISSEKMWYDINDVHGQSGGVYILRCLSESGGPIPINRLLGTDESGVLYIGKANSFLNRVAELKKSISPDYNSGSHECGSRYKSHRAITQAFPYKFLYVNLIESEEPRKVESELLNDYENKYGELPPLNRIS